jgi:Zn-dependent M16 (insulinase) family peptidase
MRFKTNLKEKTMNIDKEIKEIERSLNFIIEREEERVQSEKLKGRQLIEVSIQLQAREALAGVQRVKKILKEADFDDRI